MTSKYGFLTPQEREDEKTRAAEAEAILRSKRRQIVDATVQEISPVIRETLAGYFRGMGLSVIDDAGEEQPALFNEGKRSQGYAWRAWSRIKTGSHSDYRADGVHVLDEHTLYSITATLVVDKHCVPLLHIGDYARSKLVGGAAIPASEFALEIPSELALLLESKTGIKLVDRVNFLKAQDN